MWQTAGQDRIISFLSDSMQHGNTAHAFLFAGPPHVGKMTLALDLASALNCTGEQPPCANCHTCKRIAQGKHPDVIMLDKNAGRDPKDRKKASEISIDTIREHLQRSSNLPPYEGKYKVYIIEDADLMSVEAANCLLKTLEEPPQHVVIILLTADENKLLPTVVSRCQRFELKPVALSEIESRLANKAGIQPDRIKLLARLSNGCLGWALSGTDDDSFLKGRSTRLSEFITLINMGWDERLNYIQKLPSDRKAINEILDLWISWCRDVMLIKYNCEHAIINLDYVNDLKSWANMMTVPEIKEFIDCLNQAVINLSYNANLHLLLEVIMLDMPKKEKRADSLYSAV